MKLQTVKEIILAIVLVGVLNSFAGFLADAITKNKWGTLSNWGWATFAFFIVSILFLLGTLLWAITKLDRRIEKEKGKENQKLVKDIVEAIDKGSGKRDQALVNALQSAIQEQTKAIVAALQKNSETIIKAMREPLDGHE